MHADASPPHERPATCAGWKLRRSRCSKAYQKRLLQGNAALQQHLAANGLRWSVITSGKAHRVDEVLEHFVRAQHAAGLKASLMLAKHGVLMVQILRPRLRRSLQGTWEALKSWEESLPASFRAPMPLPLLAALVCSARIRARKCGEEAEKNRWYVFSALLLIGFFGLLRPGELLNISGGDVSLPNTLTLGSCFAVVRIARPKNARQMGVQQFVELRHEDTINWLAWLKTTSSSNRPFWKSTSNKFRYMFRQLCTSLLHISQLHLSPASLRAGGATWMMDEGYEINRIRFLGRWAHLRSLEHYIQVARAQQIALSLPMKVGAELQSFLKRSCFLLVLPHFFKSQVAPEHLVRSEPCRIGHERDAAACIRCWGRPTQTV